MHVLYCAAIAQILAKSMVILSRPPAFDKGCSLLFNGSWCCANQKLRSHMSHSPLRNAPFPQCEKARKLNFGKEEKKTKANRNKGKSTKQVFEVWKKRLPRKEGEVTTQKGDIFIFCTFHIHNRDKMVSYETKHSLSHFHLFPVRKESASRHCPQFSNSLNTVSWITKTSHSVFNSVTR